ncbi:hypothetical protein [Pseudarthrobacter sp. DSP2-3-2b1]|uniref:hypothetical protein n=1 Tax=Pseudarthrobacter sp. DSP2-3-2b1 TaxID=2804661 RepID=UPI003CECF5DD
MRIWVDRPSRSTGKIFYGLEAHDAEAVAKTMGSHMRTASRRLLAGFDASQ